MLDCDQNGGRKVSSEGNGSKSSVNDLGLSIGELGDLLRRSSAVLVFEEVILGGTVGDLGSEGHNGRDGRESGNAEACDGGEAEIEVFHNDGSQAKLLRHWILMLKKAKEVVMNWPSCGARRCRAERSEGRQSNRGSQKEIAGAIHEI